jgi:hypothetical protein
MDETTKLALIAALKKYAIEHYDQGYDTYVECYDDAEWAEFVGDHEDEASVWNIFHRVASVWADRQADARYYRDNA